MSTRKKNAVLPRQGKQGISSREEKAAPCGPPRLSPEMGAMLMVGEEHIIINQEVNDNIGFMADYIESV
ncbi:hypothetical protein [Rugamonas rivuli]|uniref:Uncharacterized protein n=1 Tax=Rugamonas rivuli TaxID=2743358 RepID=A0A843SEF5_9BURK|nr:hypothetical protein [Rugamonas rivuli]MQA19047.1 hypothetical protein [Rugamonas rivuli]